MGRRILADSRRGAGAGPGGLLDSVLVNILDSIGERHREGRIEAISGGMFSGKSEELVRRLRRAAIARQTVQVFKPGADTRHAPERLVTRDNRELQAVTVTCAGE